MLGRGLRRDRTPVRVAYVIRGLTGTLRPAQFLLSTIAQSAVRRKKSGAALHRPHPIETVPAPPNYFRNNILVLVLVRITREGAQKVQESAAFF